MSRFDRRGLETGGWGLVIAALVWCALPAVAQSRFPGVGRPATPAEVKAWDIDVRPDFTGLPKGSGSVALGMKVWDEKCASCHGTFGESNEVFTPIVGGTRPDDIKTGRVKALVTGDYPQRTTLMKLSTLSSLWDYINRAMPWNAPKSLTIEEVYAVTGYILHLGDIVPADFVLSDANIREVQNRLPNRNGKSQLHGLWDVRGKGDVQNAACMKECEKSVTVTSSLPDYARNAHGNLRDQNRLIGPVRGIVTASRGEAARTVAAAHPGRALADQHACMACHGVTHKVVGPALNDVKAKYAGKLDAATLAANIRKGGVGVWGAVPMPAQTGLSEADAKTLADWILAGAQ
ncbi:MAG: c-type cytochrome [Betaproteobacteria bacterium]|nr:c-type cytochrome [Betaproteobacteria bacterium]